MSPLNQRRLQNFRNNKRGFYSLCAFTVLFVISLFAEFIANDKPIVMSYQNELYFPVWFDYLESDLGGELELIIDFRDPYIQEKIASDGWAVWPPIPFNHDTVDWGLGEPAPAPPSARHLLGTDALASDIVAKLLYGFRLSVLFGLSLTFFASLIGITMGAIQGLSLIHI